MSTSTMRSKSKWRTNKIQMEKLIDAVRMEPNIANALHKGRVNAAFWEKLARELNKLGPPIKHHDVWKRVWCEFKCTVKRKARTKMPLSIAERKVANSLNLLTPTPESIETSEEHSEGGVSAWNMKVEVEEDTADTNKSVQPSSEEIPSKRNADSTPPGKINKILTQNEELVEVIRLKLTSEKMLLAAIQRATKANERVADEMQLNNALLKQLLAHISEDTS